MSTAPASSLPGSGSWQVPSFTVATFAERRTRFALLIPVFNEGDRKSVV